MCIGDFWAASESLDDLIIRIGRMIAYQEYNTKSPLNGLAAKWASQNTSLLPVDPRPVAPPLGHDAESAVRIEPPTEGSVAPALPPFEPKLAASQPAGEDPWQQKIVIS